MAQKFVLNVNDRLYPVNVEADTPLLYVLRNDLGLTGPKFGCGLEQCGSCMMLLDDEALPSCRRPVAHVVGKKIITLEGLTTQKEARLLQQAFIQEQAAQCGFCINGMIISAFALLRNQQSPSTNEIKAGLYRVLCRCGTYSRIVKAVQRAAEVRKDQL